MQSANVEVIRRAKISVGDSIPYYQHMATVEEITPHYLTLSFRGDMKHVTWEVFATNFGVMFTLDVDVQENTL